MRREQMKISFVSIPVISSSCYLSAERLIQAKQFIFYQILPINNGIFLESLFGSEKVVIGVAAK